MLFTLIKKLLKLTQHHLNVTLNRHHTSYGNYNYTNEMENQTEFLEKILSLMISKLINIGTNPTYLLFREFGHCLDVLCCL